MQVENSINLSKYKEEIAIYKRCLNNSNIYEDDSIGLKNIIVFITMFMDICNLVQLMLNNKKWLAFKLVILLLLYLLFF